MDFRATFSPDASPGGGSGLDPLLRCFARCSTAWILLQLFASGLCVASPREAPASGPVLLLGFEAGILGLLAAHVVLAAKRAVIVGEIEPDLEVGRVQPFRSQV